MEEDPKNVIPLHLLSAENLCQILSKMDTATFVKARYANTGLSRFIDENRRQIDIRIDLDHRSSLIFNAEERDITLRISRPFQLLRNFPARELHYLTVHKAEIKNANTPEEKEWLSNILRRSRFKSIEHVLYNNVDFVSDMFVRTTVAKFNETCKVNGSPLGQIGVPLTAQWLHLVSFPQLEAHVPFLDASVLVDIARAFADLRLENLVGWTFHVANSTREEVDTSLVPRMKGYAAMVRRHLANNQAHPADDILALYAVRNRADSVLFIRTAQESIELGRQSAMNEMTQHMNALAAVRFMGFFWTHKSTNYWK